MAETKKQTLERLYRIIDTDATAIAFQTLGQYRTFLRDTVRDIIKACDGEPSSVPQANELLPHVSQRSELLAFKRFISKTPQIELEYYSDEEFTDLYLKANCV